MHGGNKGQIYASILVASVLFLGIFTVKGAATVEGDAWQVGT